MQNDVERQRKFDCQWRDQHHKQYQKYSKHEKPPLSEIFAPNLAPPLPAEARGYESRHDEPDFPWEGQFSSGRQISVESVFPDPPPDRSDRQISVFPGPPPDRQFSENRQFGGQNRGIDANQRQFPVHSPVAPKNSLDEFFAFENFCAQATSSSHTSEREMMARFQQYQRFQSFQNGGQN